MFSSALHELFGGRAAEAVLLHLFQYGETHGRAVARDFAASLVSVQRQLERFGRSGVLVCRRQGLTRVYSWNLLLNGSPGLSSCDPNPICLLAWCQSRNAPRTFRLYRMGTRHLNPVTPPDFSPKS